MHECGAIAQEVMQNLMISAIEFRGEEDADVLPYRHATAREVMVVEPSREVGQARALLMQTFRCIMGELGRSKVWPKNATHPRSLWLVPSADGGYL